MIRKQLLSIFPILLITSGFIYGEEISQEIHRYSCLVGETPWYGQIEAGQSFKASEDGVLKSIEFYMSAYSRYCKSSDRIVCTFYDSDWKELASVNLAGYSNGSKWVECKFTEELRLEADKEYIFTVSPESGRYSIKGYKNVYPNGTMYCKYEKFHDSFRARGWDMAFRVKTAADAGGEEAGKEDPAGKFTFLSKEAANVLEYDLKVKGKELIVTVNFRQGTTSGEEERNISPRIAVLGPSWDSNMLELVDTQAGASVVDAQKSITHKNMSPDEDGWVKSRLIIMSMGNTNRIYAGELLILKFHIIKSGVTELRWHERYTAFAPRQSHSILSFKPLKLAVVEK